VVSGERSVGGLVGWTYGDDSDVTECSATGPVTGNYEVGGLIGWNMGVVERSFARGRVDGTSSVGGLVGLNVPWCPWGHCLYRCSVRNCYATAPVAGERRVGGLVGANVDSVIWASYSTGTVSADANAGGLVGENRGDGDVRASFWDTVTSGLDVSDGGTGKTTAEMQTAATFLEAAWDFVGETANGTEDIWWIDEGQDYPRLWWELPVEQE
jgi:hypothetical protein